MQGFNFFDAILQISMLEGISKMPFGILPV
jgi:hypothetical protein